MTAAGRERFGDRVGVALGDGEEEAGVGREGGAGVGGGGDEVEVDADRAGDDHVAPASSRPRAMATPGRAGSGAGPPVGRGWSSASPMRAGIADEARPQPALGRELVERVALGVGAAVLPDDVAHPGELRRSAAGRRAPARSSRGRPAPTPTSSTGSSIGVPGRRAVDDAGDLEPEDLAADDAVLDDHLEVGVHEQLREAGADGASGCDRGRRRPRQGPTSCRRPGSTVGGDANSAARRASTPAASASSTTRVTSVASCRRRPTPGPGPSAVTGSASSSSQARRAVDQGGATREVRRRRRWRTSTQDAQLGGQQRRPVSHARSGPVVGRYRIDPADHRPRG